MSTLKICDKATSVLINTNIVLVVAILSFFPAKLFAFSKKCYFCNGSLVAFVLPTLRNTKRYARLVVENVRNFQGIQESVKVRAVCVGCLHLFISRFFSRPSTKKRYISATLLLLIIILCGTERRIKGCARHKTGIWYENKVITIVVAYSNDNNILYNTLRYRDDTC